MILSIPRPLVGGGCCSAAAILVAALLIASENGGGCSRPHSSSSANYGSCGSFLGMHVVGVDAFTLPTSRATATHLYSSYLDSITASVAPSSTAKKKSHSPSSSSIGKSANAALANGAATPPPNFRSFSSSERTERKLRGTLGQLPIREDHLQSLVSDE